MLRKQKKRPPKPNNCSKKYQQWDDESMSGAIKSIMEGKMGINRVASQHDIPRTTLKDRPRGSPGPLPFSIRRG